MDADEEGDLQEPDEWFEPELPDGTFYEETIDDTKNIYDTEEFDEVYSTYIDAKQRLNQLRQSRGFYPVVAVVNGKGQAPLVAQNPKGSAKGGKTKNKPKGKNSGSKGSSKGPTGKNRAKAALTCLRCGKAGHFAANCPAFQQTGGSSPKRRVIDLEDPMISLVMNIEHNPDDMDEGEVTADEDIFYDVEDAYVEGEVLVRAGGWLTNEPETCIQDRGASSFLIGSEYALLFFSTSTDAVWAWCPGHR